MTGEFVQLRQVFGLHRFKLQRHLVDGTVKSVWLMQVFGFSGFGLDRFSFIGGGNRSTRRKPPTCRKSLMNVIT